MARGKHIIKKRQIEGDPLFGSRLLSKLVNRLMRDGKKSVAQKEVYRALEILKKTNEDPVKTVEQALNTVGPRMEVRPRRVGGASYQVPMEVRGDRRLSLSIRWLIAAAHKRPSRDYHTFAEKLAAEISDVLKGQGDAVRKRDTMQRMADANRAFAHFRW